METSKARVQQRSWNSSWSLSGGQTRAGVSRDDGDGVSHGDLTFRVLLETADLDGDVRGVRAPTDAVQHLGQGEVVGAVAEGVVAAAAAGGAVRRVESGAVARRAAVRGCLNPVLGALLPVEDLVLGGDGHGLHASVALVRPRRERVRDEVAVAHSHAATAHHVHAHRHVTNEIDVAVADVAAGESAGSDADVQITLPRSGTEGVDVHVAAALGVAAGGCACAGARAARSVTRRRRGEAVERRGRRDRVAEQRRPGSVVQRALGFSISLTAFQMNGLGRNETLGLTGVQG